ncbi:MAG TPA: hypothetical protein VFS08_10395, partial [Gemmatimonadaceae bacterium]|nr:hypothetical protein [Gemmatimonadaceae bacterium]
MTDSTGSTLAQVTALDEERRRYEGWLAQLDERHGSTPERVLQRVRADYEGRLRDVVERLGEHAELLQGTVEERTRLVEELRTAEQERRDARAEAELRAMVGEYSEEQWRELAARADEELDELSGRREAAEEELTRLQQVLELAHRGQAAAAAPERGDGVASAAEEVASAPTEEWPAVGADQPTGAPTDAR